jgi:hypothetical protein
VMKFSEASEFSNRFLVDFHASKTQFGAGLEQKYLRLRGELNEAKAELSAVRRLWRESRWLRLGRKIGIKSARETGKPQS